METKNPIASLEIKSRFFSRGFNHRLLKRHGLICLFERSHRHSKSHPHFEVVRLRNSPPYQIAGITIPASETYPHSESWGTNGFTYQSRQSAEAKFISLC